MGRREATGSLHRRLGDDRLRRGQLLLQRHPLRVPGQPLKDPKIDELADKGRTELNPDKRKAIFKQIWDLDLDQAYHPVVASGGGFNVLQPWVRGMRFGGALSTTNSYQDIGDIVAEAWIDK